MATRHLFPTLLPLFLVFLLVLARRPVHMLRRRGAVSRETAQPLADLGPRDRARLERLVARGVVREAAPGTYYHDAAAERARFRSRLPEILALVAVVALMALALLYWAGRRAGGAP